MNESLRSTLFGILLGILGNIVGFFLFGFIVTMTKDVSFNYFYEVMFLGTDVFKSQVITGALMVNVVLFYFLMRKGSDGMVRGMIITILLSVMALVYYYA